MNRLHLHTTDGQTCIQILTPAGRVYHLRAVIAHTRDLGVLERLGRACDKAWKQTGRVEYRAALRACRRCWLARKAELDAAAARERLVGDCLI